MEEEGFRRGQSLPTGMGAAEAAMIQFGGEDRKTLTEESFC